MLISIVKYGRFPLDRCDRWGGAAEATRDLKGNEKKRRNIPKQKKPTQKFNMIPPIKQIVCGSMRKERERETLLYFGGVQ